MKENALESLSNLIKKIKVTPENEELIRRIEDLIDDGKYIDALPLIKQLKENGKIVKHTKEQNIDKKDEDNDEYIEEDEYEETPQEDEEIDLQIKDIYPK